MERAGLEARLGQAGLGQGALRESLCSLQQGQIVHRTFKAEEETQAQLKPLQL